jgi:hypothetical protein
VLTEAACRNANRREKPYKLPDSGALHLHVSTTGVKSWRWKYRFAGKEKLLSLGQYPDISLKSARKKRDAARDLLQEGIDPSAEKKRRKAAEIAEALNSFERVARAWHKVRAKSLSPRYAAAILSRLENNVFPALGRRPVRDISPPEVLEVIRRIEARGAHDMAHRVRNHISDVFVWAISSGLAETDPAGIIRKALEPTDPRSRPAMVKLKLARTVLEQTEQRAGAHWSTLLASRLLALTAARPGVVRLAEKAEFEDLDGRKPIWRIPAAKMKLTQQRKRDITWEFVIPLSRQAVAVVKAAIATTPSPTYLFTGIGSWLKPISDSTLSKLYRQAGFTGQHVPHGWRATFSTLMNELAAVEDRERDRAIIDLMLAHAQEGVEPIYNRAAYMPRRRQIAQTWADMLMEGMAEPDLLLPTHRPWRATSVEAEHDRRPRKRQHMAA